MELYRWGTAHLTDADHYRNVGAFVYSNRSETLDRILPTGTENTARVLWCGEAGFDVTRLLAGPFEYTPTSDAERRYWHTPPHDA